MTISIMVELMPDILNSFTAQLIGAVVLLVLYVIKTSKRFNRPPGPYPLPVIGNFLELTKDIGNNVHVFQRLSQKYGKLCSLKVGKIEFLVISDYKLLMEAFVKKSDTFSSRPKDNIHSLKYLNDTLGAGIVFNDGYSWKELRRTSIVAMRDFGVGKKSLEEKIQDEIHFLLDRIDQNRDKPFSARNLFHLATSNIICGIIFGSRFCYDDNKFQELLKILQNSFNINPFFNLDNFFPFLRIFPYFQKVTQEFGRIMMDTADFVKELTSSNEATFDPENMRDFVDIFIKMKRGQLSNAVFDEKNMCRTIVDLFLAGSDTTANTLSWAMLYMAKYPHLQTRCQREIDEVLGKSRRPCAADRDQLTYVEATLLEVLRVRPVGALGLPHCTNRDVELGGYDISKDTVVFADLVSINSDPETFPQPDEFKPEHFLDDHGGIVNRERMVSFSVGPRTCLGENLARTELSLMFVSILQTYTISPEPGQCIDLSPQYVLVLRHKPQNLVFTRRE